MKLKRNNIGMKSNDNVIRTKQKFLPIWEVIRWKRNIGMKGKKGQSTRQFLKSTIGYHGFRI